MNCACDLRLATKKNDKKETKKYINIYTIHTYLRNLLIVFSPGKSKKQKTKQNLSLLNSHTATKARIKT